MIRKRLIRLWNDWLFGGLEFDTVLDIGSGNGKMIDYFKSRGKKVTAIDLHPQRPEIKKMDFLKNNFKDSQFDLVYSAHVIEHQGNADEFAKELVRVAKKYVCTIAPQPSRHFWDEPEHLRPYTAESLKRTFHLNESIRHGEIGMHPFFEDISFVVFEKKDSNLVKKK